MIENRQKPQNEVGRKETNRPTAACEGHSEAEAEANLTEIEEKRRGRKNVLRVRKRRRFEDVEAWARRTTIGIMDRTGNALNKASP